MAQTDLLREWLTDTYGVESSLMDIMETQLADLTGQHEMEDKVQQYLRLLHQHANLVQDRIMALKGETSSLNKGGLPTFINSMKDLWQSPTSSTLVKHSIVDFAAVHYEIAQFDVVRAAARGIGDEETARVCQEILSEKREMARWLDEHTPRLVHQITETLGGQHGASENNSDKVDGAGTLHKRYLYAVADDERTARNVEQALQDQGVTVERLQGAAAARSLREEAQGPHSIVGKIARGLKGLAGETQQAEHYATQVENGRIVLSAPCADRATADKLIAAAKEQGGYNFAYLTGGSIESVE
jgi:ferritin-like metal-binding protein YciE